MSKATSAASTSAALYSLAVVLSPASEGPEDVKEKAHHLKNGFQNPWEYVICTYRKKNDGIL